MWNALRATLLREEEANMCVMDTPGTGGQKESVSCGRKEGKDEGVVIHLTDGDCLHTKYDRVASQRCSHENEELKRGDSHACSDGRVVLTH